MKTELVVALGDPYFSVERPWGELPAGMQRSGVSDVAVDADDRVYVYQRADPPIVVFDAGGAYVDSWGSDFIADAHGIFITSNGLVLVADRDAHQVLGFHLVMTPPAKAGGFSEERLLALTAASRTKLGSSPKVLPTLAYEGPIQAAWQIRACVRLGRSPRFCPGCFTCRRSSLHNPANIQF